VIELETRSAAETERVAARLANVLLVGDVVTVAGELGAGKTTFVRGACRALGVPEHVTSPTFTIGHRYAAAVPVAHLDLYRFQGVSAAEWGDLEPYFDEVRAWGVDKVFAYPGDGIIARTWVGAASRIRFERHTELLRAGDRSVLAKALTVWCPIDARTGKPTSVSAEVRAGFSVEPKQTIHSVVENP